MSSGAFLKVVLPPHACEPPNPWVPGKDHGPPRLRYGVGTIWKCDCGQQWVIPLTFSGRGWEKMRSG